MEIFLSISLLWMHLFSIHLKLCLYRDTALAAVTSQSAAEPHNMVLMVWSHHYALSISWKEWEWKEIFYANGAIAWHMKMKNCPFVWQGITSFLSSFENKRADFEKDCKEEENSKTKDFQYFGPFRKEETCCHCKRISNKEHCWKLYRRWCYHSLGWKGASFWK